MKVIASQKLHFNQRLLHRYNVGQELKREMDYVQIFFNCCGDKNYVDWFRYFWSDKADASSDESQASEEGQSYVYLYVCL